MYNLFPYNQFINPNRYLFTIHKIDGIFLIMLKLHRIRLLLDVGFITSCIYIDIPETFIYLRRTTFYLDISILFRVILQ